MTDLPPPIVAGTLQTDPRSGGIKRSSGVNVLPVVAETWAQVRDDVIPVDWLIAGYDGTSKTDITVLDHGDGGLQACARAIPSHIPVFGGCRLHTGRFVTFFYADEETPTMLRGRASMHKNGVLNVLEGSDGEIQMKRDMEKGENSVQSRDEGPENFLTKESLSMAEELQQSTLDSLEENATSMPGTLLTKGTPLVEDISGGFLPYSQLMGDLPPGVDPLHRELALSDEEFQCVFEMDKNEFAKLPTWKQTSLKKSKRLF